MSANMQIFNFFSFPRVGMGYVRQMGQMGKNSGNPDLEYQESI